VLPGSPPPVGSAPPAPTWGVGPLRRSASVCGPLLSLRPMLRPAVWVRPPWSPGACVQRGTRGVSGQLAWAGRVTQERHPAMHGLEQQMLAEVRGHLRAAQLGHAAAQQTQRALRQRRPVRHSVRHFAQQTGCGVLTCTPAKSHMGALAMGSHR